MNATKQVNNVILRDSVLKEVYNAEFYKRLKNVIGDIYKECEKQYFSETWISFELNGNKGWYNTKFAIAVPVQKNYAVFESWYFEFGRVNLDYSKTRSIFGDKECPSEIMNGIKKSAEFDGEHWVAFDYGSYSVESGRFANWHDEQSVKVGVAEITLKDFRENILSQKFTILSDDRFKKAVEIIKERKISVLSEAEIEELVKLFSVDRKKIEIETFAALLDNYSLSDDIAHLYTQQILSCDAYRAELEKYDSKRLEDVNSGHWELWEKSEVAEGEISVSLEKPLIARNPVADIHASGIIGIDFGTKSTIVSRQDGTEKTTLMRVGIGQLGKIPEAHHYENPTIMEFVNLEKFIADYNSRDGRPETFIYDMTVSHKANNNLKNSSQSDLFYSYFYDIKQWCGDTERNVKIIDQQGTEKILPSFVSLEKGDFNPLELYAYYLGLYINNMRNGIYLNYILSFPVTYEKTVKDKILESFTAGLRKSLPETVLRDESVMKNFKVRQGVSEPAAYAITALQGYGFEPENENIFYSIFDFGGGTTDFDFGVWRCAGDNREEERYDYVITHFGSEGDKYLGGENLLELMAYEVFKANANLLLKNSRKGNEESAGYTFTRPKESDDFAGSETLVDNSSQEARRNTKQLMEALRPFWEGIIDIAENQAEDSDEKINYNGYVFKNSPLLKEIKEHGEITVNLFDRNGNEKCGQKLYISNSDENINVNLIEILEKRIERGVESFFKSIRLAFGNETALQSGVNEIQIFLAGNSSKSPILKKLFDKNIEEENKRISVESKTDDEHFKLFPPLGTAEAFKIQKERGINVSENDVTAPTGKTGVAYGLIAGREGGVIKVISEVKPDEETKFRYNLGRQQRKMFKLIIDRSIDYGVWVRFIDAGVETFEIYYTSSPVVGKLDIDAPSVHKIPCTLPYTDTEADVYIRAVSPEEIEYTIAERNIKPDEKAETFRVHLSE